MTKIIPAIILVVFALRIFRILQKKRAHQLVESPERKRLAEADAELWPADTAEHEALFWNIVADSLAGNDDEASQLQSLRDALTPLHSNDVAKFIAVFDRLMKETYRWDLWGAAHVIRGGCSDDSFEDFRKWLISCGRNFFESAAGDPDRLAELIESDHDGDACFEEYSYTAIDVWSQKAGRDYGELPKDKNAKYPAEPVGKSWDEDDLPMRYPNLWKRFGDNPLG